MGDPAPAVLDVQIRAGLQPQTRALGNLCLEDDSRSCGGRPESANRPADQQQHQPGQQQVDQAQIAPIRQPLSTCRLSS